MELYTVAAEVRAHIEHKRSDYLRFLNAVRGVLEEEKRRSEGSIHRVYSRGERQLDKSEFKDENKIARRVAAEREIEPEFPVSKVWDIIGLTVVCDYLSDMEQITARLADLNTGACRASVEYKKDRGDRGYYARHITLESRMPDASWGLRCEVQVKTLLHDAWGAKTHDLSYKPSGDLDARIEKQMQIVGDTLQLVEQQSQILRALIRERWTADDKRKAAVRQELGWTMLKLVKDEPEGAKETANLLTRREAELRLAPLESDEIADVLHAIEEIAKLPKGLGQACVLMTFLATLRPSPDLKPVMQSFIERWFQGATTPTLQFQVLHFEAYALFGCGDIDGAIAACEHALRVAATDSIPPSLSVIVKSDLAYYIAVLDGGTEKERLKRKSRATGLISDVAAILEATPNLPFNPAALANTRGAVLIAFGGTEEEIREGLLLCSEAASLATDEREQQLARLFFALDERRAWRRLLQL